MKRMLLLFFQFLLISGFAQKRIVVMGSSTAYGSAADSYQQSWAGLTQALFRKNTSDSKDTIVTNIGISGYTTYQEMPTGYIPPTGRPLPDVNHNVDKALSFEPDIVIINLPSGDIALGYTKLEFISNLRTMYNYITATGAKCFITTTQPRNDISSQRKQWLKDMVDSINKSFGVYSINFWDGLVTADGTNSLRDDARHIGYPDEDYHLNNYGHSLVFNSVRSKNIFSVDVNLPLVLVRFTAQSSNGTVVLKWRSEKEEANTDFVIQRSKNGILFENIFTQIANGNGQTADYSWTDYHPMDGKNFYRLKIIETNKISYSPIVSIINKTKGLVIEKLYNGSSDLTIKISSNTNQVATISLMNLAGIVLYKQDFRLNAGDNKLILPIYKFPAGDYVISVNLIKGPVVSQKLALIK